MKSIKLPFKLLIYDIETGLLKANIFRLGEQTIRHTQLDNAHAENSIICISAKWYGEKKVYVFEGDDCVEEFDKLARKADVCLGKNSDRFDVKYINTARMMRGLKPFPEWMDTREDLEKQLRKYFAFPSQSLDYISTLFGYGGKEKMAFEDWVAIDNYKTILKLDKLSTYSSEILFGATVGEVIEKGRQALKKMIHYNKKDVLDTEAVLVKVLPYIRLKYNAAVTNDKQGCTTCGSRNLLPTKIITKGNTRYQQFDCLDHNGYAGKATVRYTKSRNKIFGSMG
jgi:hypothetical protein